VALVILIKFVHSLKRINMSWNSFKNLAKQKTYQSHTWRQAKDSLVIEHANKQLLQMLGDQAENKAQVIYFKNKILTIAVLSDEVLARLTEDKEVFIAAINEHWQQSLVTDLHFLS
jgi:hypothetical protein